MEPRTASPSIGEVLTVKVDRMAPAGDGLAKAEGSNRVVFVPGAAPGDRLEVEVFDAKNSFARARIKKVLSSIPSGHALAARVPD